MNIITKGLGSNLLITLGYGFNGVGDYTVNDNNFFDNDDDNFTSSNDYFPL